MKRGRLDWYEPHELDGHARQLYDRITGGPRARGPQALPLTDDAGRLEGPFNALLVSPEIGTAVQELGTAIRYRGALSDRAREIAILEVAALHRSEFEWYAHERLGRRAGLTGAEIAALRDGVAAPSFDRVESLVRTVVRALVRERDLDDASYHDASDVLGNALLMELVALVGYYELLALNLRVWRTPLPDGAEPVFAPA